MKKILLGLLTLASISAFAGNCMVKTTQNFTTTFPELSDELTAKGYILDTSIKLNNADFILNTSTYEDTHCRGCQFPKMIAKHVRTIIIAKVNKSNDGKIYQTIVADADGKGRYGGYSYPTSGDVERAKRKAQNEFLRKMKNNSCK